MATNRCITCGIPIPEGRQVCKQCEDHGKKQPDLVEVVRCKDCKYYKNDTYYCREHNKGYCEWDNTIKTKTHFCSYGERKE